jgi:hypothetical protein
MARRKKANYDGEKNYLQFLTALRRMFTNDVDIIPIIDEFNFYIKGAYGQTYLDLFRAYEENPEDIHGTEKYKKFIDDGTIGVINEEVYRANGNLIQALESLRVFLEDRRTKYIITYSPFVNAYVETVKPNMVVLSSTNPEIVNVEGETIYTEPMQTPTPADTTTTGGNELAPPDDRRAVDMLPDRTIPALPLIPKKKKRKSFWQYLSFLSYKNKKK